MNDIDEKQDEILKGLLLETERKYLTDANIRQLILSGDAGKRAMLEVIDAIHQNAATSLRFKQYRRTQRFLFALNAMCRECFS